jgi:hypothetical protein
MLSANQSRQAQNDLLLHHPLWLVVGLWIVLGLKRAYTEILCKRMSWIVAQTIARQMVSVVNTSI